MSDTLNKKEIKTDDYHLLNGDCVQEIKKIEDNKADLVVFSPPFAELYVYSDKEEDMGNVSDYHQFEKHFKFLIPDFGFFYFFNFWILGVYGPFLSC